MFLPRLRSRIAFGLAAGAFPLLLTLSLHGQPPPTTPLVPGSGSPKQVADALDSLVQPRFQDTNASSFGLSRLIPAVRGHEPVGYLGSFQTRTPAEATLLARADAARRPYVIAFLHCVPTPNAPGQSVLPLGFTGKSSEFSPHLSTVISKGGINSNRSSLTTEYLHKTEPLFQAAAIKALPLAKMGYPVQTDSGEWTLFLRPVTASKEACLGCHTSAKRGDMLGVMVYAVSKTQTKS